LFVVVAVVFCVAFAFVWTYLIDTKYWAWRKRLHLRKLEKQKLKYK
jgi:hypothetical protein